MKNTIYTVQSGDTLYQIAKKYGTDVITLARYNGIPDPDQLSVGQLLRIPVGEGSDTVNIYVIRPGDTLTRIAQLFDVTVEELAALNDIADPDRIRAGVVLQLPEKTNGKAYMVQSGDTLWKIAEKYGMPLTELINLNCLTDPDRIYAGQILKLS